MNTVALDVGAVGTQSESWTVSWSVQQAILYALSVGAGQDDPHEDLSLTTEESVGGGQQVLPTLAVVLGQAGLTRRFSFGNYDRGALVHAEQQVRMHRSMQPEGAAELTAFLEAIHDKGSGVLVDISVEAISPADRAPMWSSRHGYFVRGARGGDDGPLSTWVDPPEEPDETTVVRTRSDQALLYRLNGDLNPLHVDPDFARRAGFDRPILHGLCTYGAVARVLTQRLCDGNQSRVRSLSARFTKPVYPGDELKIRMWRGDGAVRFDTLDADGQPALSRGTFEYA